MECFVVLIACKLRLLRLDGNDPDVICFVLLLETESRK